VMDAESRRPAASIRLERQRHLSGGIPAAP
jgi:hypothetical protein